MSSILIIDNDRYLKNFTGLLVSAGHNVSLTTEPQECLNLVNTRSFDLLIMEAGERGIDLFEEVRKLQPDLKTIVMSTFASTETAIKAIRLGAFEYVLMPFNDQEVLELVDQALQSVLPSETAQSLNSGIGMPPGGSIIGQAPAMLDVYRTIGRVAPKNVTVLVRGESGTGKELVCRAIHHYSKRSDKAFQVIDCAAIPETLLESELFGYEKGAFTGAEKRRPGKIEDASGGTLFLDEIGEMPLSIQAKILRLIQEKKIQRLGSGRDIDVDVRIIAATNRNLEEALTNGRFREDLYYRLKVVSLWVPPLRKRLSDIPLLTDYLLERASIEMETRNPGISDSAREVLLRYSWPGNVREMANTLQKALLFSRGCLISSASICQAIDETGSHPCEEKDVLSRTVRGYLTENKITYPQLMEIFSRSVIVEALGLNKGNRTKTSRMLGISRQTLISKIARYHIQP